eukprot:4414416-Ditylum_brightwellii.AAC.1
MDYIRCFLIEAISNNDAEDCYNCMIPELTSIHLQALGLHAKAAKTSALLNHNATHHVKTTAGILSDSYKSTPECPNFGKRQGKGSLPSNWLFTSSIILAALHCLWTGLHLISVYGRFIAQRVAEAYVDDSDCTYLNKQDNNNKIPTTIKNQITKIAQTWEKLLFGSGGRLSKA